MASVPMGAFATHKIRANANGKWQEEEKKSDGYYWGKKHSKDQFPFGKFNQECEHIFCFLNFLQLGWTFQFDAVMEQPPVKYNSKLMNSIWGQYNKYSVHNFKQIAGDVFGFRQQQPIANDKW
jgi:hypothetical protein